jgi:hypothetical protein
VDSGLHKEFSTLEELVNKCANFEDHLSICRLRCVHKCMQGRTRGLLSKNGHVVCFKSRKLKEHERLYANHDLELTTIVHNLNMWQHYLMGKIFELRIDHCG